MSDADLEEALDEAGVSAEVQGATLDANRDARLDGLRAALAILAVMVTLALFAAQRIPSRPVGAAET